MSADEQRRPRRTVGRRRGGNNGLLLAALLVLAAACVFLLFVVADALNGNGDGEGTPATTTQLPATTATPVPATDTAEPSPSPTAPGNATPPPTTAARTPTPDNTILLPCDHNILAPVDKQHRLPADCVPPDLVAAGGGQLLRAEAARALLEMYDEAAKEGHSLFSVSGYRSYQTQLQIYQNSVAQNGQEYTDRFSARPGHSEHQLGTAMDVSSPAVGGELVQEFGDTPEGRWVAANAHRFGFVISYPAGKEAITGYAYEPWHLRYVGKDVAPRVLASGVTLREYLLR